MLCMEKKKHKNILGDHWVHLNLDLLRDINGININILECNDILVIWDYILISQEMPKIFHSEVS